MFKAIFAALVAAAALCAPTGASAQRVDVLVMQLDADPDSLERGGQIQDAILIEFRRILNAPDVMDMMEGYGIQGLDVIDETAAWVDAGGGYDTRRTRRTREELIALTKELPGQSIDALVFYTIYLRAVTKPYTGITALQGSLRYEVLNRDGRFLGGDRVNLETSGIPFTGCAAAADGIAPDSHCVREFGAEHGSALAAEAANRIALDVAALIGKASASGGLQLSRPDDAGVGTDDAALDGGFDTPVTGAIARDECRNLPVAYLIKFNGVTGRDLNAIEEFMATWRCGAGLESESMSPTGATYRYQSSADRMRIARNLRQTFEAMGILASTRFDGERTIVIDMARQRTR